MAANPRYASLARSASRYQSRRRRGVFSWVWRPLLFLAPWVTLGAIAGFAYWAYMKGAP